MAEKNYGITSVIDDDGSERPQDGLTRRREDSATQNGTMERYINILGILNFGFTLQCGWESVGTTLYIIFANGGPAVLVYGTLLSIVGHTAIAMSLGEMASMDPTVGAQYRWSAKFAKKWPEFWGLMQGWITTFAWGVSAITGLVVNATIITTLISFHDPTYVPKAWHTLLIMWAILTFVIAGNLWMRKILNALETIGGICHVLFFVALVITLCTLGERKPASYVFQTITYDVSGWNTPGLGFHLGLLAVVLPLYGYDSVLHMIDETKQPRERVPKAMIFSVVGNGVLQLAYGIVLMFFVGDLEKTMASPMPVLEIFLQATKSKTAATVALLMHMFPGIVSLFNVIASASRLTWAFARDKGLPCHNFFSRVHPKLQIPLQALGLNVAILVLLSLINLGSTVAVAALMAVPTCAIFVSYGIPIALLMMRKLSGEHPRYGPFKLGSYGLPVNLLALLFSIYSAFWMSFPTYKPVTSINMNYAGPITIAVILLALLDWFTTGKKRFEVPTARHNIVWDDSDSPASGKELSPMGSMNEQVVPSN